MPNWCEGSLKVRGRKDDILNFIKNGLKSYKYVKDHNEPVEIVDMDEWIDWEYFGDTEEPESVLGPIQFICNHNWIHVNETKRAFINEDVDVYLYSVNEKNDKYIALFGVRQAWEFETEDWLNIAKKYDLDIKLYGIESGMGFWQEIEIIGGDIMTDYISIKENYASYIWSCPFPWMGG